MQNKVIRLFLFISMLILLSACGHMDASNTQKSNRISPVWPQPPATPKIKFEQAFSTPAELGIGRSIWQWLGDVVFGEDDIHMLRPMAIVTVGEHLVYVADPGMQGVHRFNTREESYHLIQRADELPLPSPVALAVDKTGNVLVSDSSLKLLLVIRKNSDLAVPVKLDVALQQPTGLAIDKTTGDIYLLDTSQHQLLVFNAAGELKKRLGQRGIKPGEFNFPTHIQLSNDHLLVTDAMNFRIQIFNLQGKYLSEFGQAGQSSGYLSRPKGVATDQQGNIYIVDGLLNNIQLFNRQGQLLMAMGEQGQQIGEFWLPTGIHINEQQKIYVADSHNRRVQVFRYLRDAL